MRWTVTGGCAAGVICLPSCVIFVADARVLNACCFYAWGGWHDFNAGKGAGPELTSLVHQLCRREPGRAAELLDCSWRMAVLSGQLSSDARVLLDAWSNKAGVGSAEQQRMHQKHQRHQRSSARAPLASQDAVQQAAALLRVDLSASPEEIKRAYRRQLSLHHPDKLIARGVVEPNMSGAGEQIHRIQVEPAAWVSTSRSSQPSMRFCSMSSASIESCR